MAEQDEGEQRPALMRTVDDRRQVIDVVGEAHDAGSFALAAPVSAMVERDHREPLCDETFGQPFVAAAMLRKPVRDDDNAGRRRCLQPRFPVNPQTTSADKAVDLLTDVRVVLHHLHRREPSQSIWRSTTPKAAFAR